MKTGNTKYDTIINMLRSSTPELTSAENIEREVLNRIQSGKKSGKTISDIMDFLFSWIYIGWVRRSLVTASLALLGLFLWQQNSILREIGSLQQQITQNNRETSYDPSGILNKKLTIYRMSGIKPGAEIDQSSAIPDSMIEMQSRYRDLVKIIEEDPDLKKMVESRLRKNLRGKFNL